MTSSTKATNNSDPKQVMQEAGKVVWEKAGQAGNLAKKGTQWSLYTFAMSHIAWRSQAFWMAPWFVKIPIMIGSVTLCTWTGSFVVGFISDKSLPGPRNLLEATNPATILFNKGSDNRDWFNKKTGEIDKKAVEWNKQVIGNEK